MVVRGVEGMEKMWRGGRLVDAFAATSVRAKVCQHTMVSATCVYWNRLNAGELLMRSGELIRASH